MAPAVCRVPVTGVFSASDYHALHSAIASGPRRGPVGQAQRATFANYSKASPTALRQAGSLERLRKLCLSGRSSVGVLYQTVVRPNSEKKTSCYRVASNVQLRDQRIMSGFGASLWTSARRGTGRTQLGLRSPFQCTANATGSMENSKSFSYPDPVLFVETDSPVIAIGDVHGDLQQTIRALQIGGLVSWDSTDVNDVHWTGGTKHLVQMGDFMDRGDDEIGILLLLRKLAQEAEAAGGAVHILNGNHEFLNVSADFRYVTMGALAESKTFWDKLQETFGEDGFELGVQCDLTRNPFRDAAFFDLPGQDSYEKRRKLFCPGGAVAKQLARNNLVLVVNDTCFVHGGLMPRHVEFGLNKLNKTLSAWMRGEKDIPDISLAMEIANGSENSMVWNRTFSVDSFNDQQSSGREKLLRDILEAVSKEVGTEVNRMVMGHSVQQQGINAAYDNMAWRIDVGLSRGVVGASPEVLEIKGDQVKVLIDHDPEYLGRGFPEKVDTDFPEGNVCSLLEHADFFENEKAEKIAAAEKEEEEEEEDIFEGSKIIVVGMCVADLGEDGEEQEVKDGQNEDDQVEWPVSMVARAGDDWWR